jgi:hypothetical protein
MLLKDKDATAVLKKYFAGPMSSMSGNESFLNSSLDEIAENSPQALSKSVLMQIEADLIKIN